MVKHSLDSSDENAEGRRVRKRTTIGMFPRKRSDVDNFADGKIKEKAVMPPNVHLEVSKLLYKLCYPSLQTVLGVSLRSKLPFPDSSPVVGTREDLMQNLRNGRGVSQVRAKFTTTNGNFSYRLSSSGSLYPYRGRGPTWIAATCTLDCCIVAAIFLDAGFTVADMASLEAQTERQRLTKSLVAHDWTSHTLEDSRTAKDPILDEIVNETQKSLREEDKDTVNKETFFDLGDVWNVCSSGWGQFKLTLQGKQTPNSDIGSNIVELYTLICSPETIQDYFMPASSPSHIKAEDPPLVIGDVPPRLALYTYSDHRDPEQVARKKRLTAEGFSFQYMSEGTTEPRTATYKWIGGIYLRPENAHYRVYWSDEDPQHPRNIKMYDGMLYGGIIIGGIEPPDKDGRVPRMYDWRGAILIYERTDRPSQKTVLGEVKACLERIEDPEKEAAKETEPKVLSLNKNKSHGLNQPDLGCRCCQNRTIPWFPTLFKTEFTEYWDCVCEHIGVSSDWIRSKGCSSAGCFAPEALQNFVPTKDQKAQSPKPKAQSPKPKATGLDLLVTQNQNPREPGAEQYILSYFLEVQNPEKKVVSYCLGMSTACLSNGKASLACPTNPTRNATFFSLPSDLQEDVFRSSDPSDLFNLAQVSHHFRVIAASHLYRKLELIFDDEDSSSYDYWMHHVAQVLETLATSDYNYAQHVKEICADTRSGGDEGELAVVDYSNRFTSGLFLNTLLLSTLKKVKVLETFHWNVRIELSATVYDALYRLRTLQNLHIRLQAGAASHRVQASSPSSYPGQPYSAPPLPLLPGDSPPPWSTSPHPQPCISKTSSLNKQPREIIHSKRSGRETPTFANFKGLSKIEILDMDSLDYVNGIAKCVRSSSGTVKTLKLSFSGSLALKARKAPAPPESDSETDPNIDEFSDGGLMVPPPLPPGMSPQHSGAAHGSGAVADEAEIRRQRAAQEKVLAKIFDLDNPDASDKTLELKAERAMEKANQEAEVALRDAAADSDRQFVEGLRLAVGQMRKESGPGQSKKALETVELAASVYLKSLGNSASISKKLGQTPTVFKHQKKKQKKALNPNHSYPAFFSSNMPPMPGPGPYNSYLPPKPKTYHHPLLNPHYPNIPIKKKKPIHGKKAVASSSKNQNLLLGWAETYHDSGAEASYSIKNGKEKSSTVDGIDDSVPELFVGSSSGSKPKDPEDPIDKEVDIEHPDELDEDGIPDQEFIETPEGAMEEERPLTNGYILDSDVLLKGKGKEPMRTSDEPLELVSDDQALRKYIRSTHGLPLESLSIYLIPVKASILARAVDPFSLRRITLLNVGPQRAYWSLLTKLQKERPLPLRSIYTDNVTPAFLIFLNELEGLDDLFMLERGSKPRIEPFAPKTAITASEIKKHILNKHLKTMKRLMIRNEDDGSWDLGRSIIRFICKEGQNLQELSFATSSSGYHVLMQSISNLTSLLVLHIHTFRAPETCATVLRELRSSAVDNIAHYPHLKIKYVAIHNFITILIRHEEKEQSGGTGTPGTDEDNLEEFRIRCLEGETFIEQSGVRIWRKDIISGAL
ncbi:MAG: hypothetical protein M1834_007125 [Cirrosporium novae-zelandiae]|nr:MAG: hypothetical protein M1834_007125 [Cirrosporium novae-zelandiae]